MKNIAAFAATAICFTAILTCVICDLAIAGTLTWSLISGLSIVFAWLIVLPCLHSFTAALSAVTLFTLPYLYILGLLLHDAPLLFPIGVRMTVIALVYLWCVRLFFRFLRHRKAAAAACLLAVPLCLTINFCLTGFFGGPLVDGWDILAFFVMGIAAAVLLVSERR